MFITFEGPEGSGKSTQILKLKERLINHGKKAINTFEPGGTSLGKEIRNLLLHSIDMSEVSELLLYAADRAEHVRQIIKPALKDDIVVISDRYYHSTLAYQGYGRNIDLSLIKKIMEIAISGVEPDIIFLIDVPVELGFERIQSSGRQKDRIEKEKIEFHRSIRNGYLDMAKSDKRFIILDGMDSIDNIHQKIWGELNLCW
ncbi:MAG: dTMP kinase [Candidatus Muirbacterium halophilum]|nr:dTMP kinase [Candidatus Muirbacterium halophilum]MCK9474799.1 dTMP kinase [Candidatus Muirbacterium halophilum]